MTMRILYLSQYFPPEAGATQSRAYDMAQSWKNLGHKVIILTEFPNHPSGIISAEYKGKLFERDNLDGLEVIRVWVKTSPVKNFSNRMLFYISYMVNAFIAGLVLVKGKFNFIYATSPPLFVGGAALLLSYIKHIPFAFEVRDLWPESAIALGELSSPRAISFATQLEEKCYSRAFRIVVVTQGIYNHLLKRGIPAEKLIVLPNGANIDLFIYSQAERDHIRQILGLEQKFIVIYAGILGLAQGLETILEVAHLLVNYPEIHFLLIGDGPKKTELVTLAKSYNLSNLSFLPEKPREQIPGYLSASDIALIPLRNVEIFKGVLPSKLFDAWACEIPVLVSIDGEARQLVEQIRGGIFVPPEDSARMAEILVDLTKSPEELQAMGKNGREYTKQHHSRQILAEKLIISLEKYISNNKII